jgi:hypothetical protein
MTEKRPYCTRRTGTVTFTIIEAHPYHKAAYIVAGAKFATAEIFMP